MEPADDVILHEQDGEAFLLHVPSGKYFGLNETGLVIWKALVAGDSSRRCNSPIQWFDDQITR